MHCCFFVFRCKPSIFAEYHKQRVETVDYCTPHGNHGYISPSVTIETQLSLCALGDDGSYANLSGSRPSVNNDQHKRYSRYSENDNEYYSDNYSRIRGDTSLRDVSASSASWDVSNHQHHEILLEPAQLDIEEFTTHFPTTQYTPAASCADVSYCCDDRSQQGSLYHDEFGSRCSQQDSRHPNRRGAPSSYLYSTVDSDQDEYSCYVELHDSSRPSRDFQAQLCINTRDRKPDQYGQSKRFKNAMRKCKNVGSSFVDGVKNKSSSISARVRTANLLDESDSKKSSSFKTLKSFVPPLRKSRLRLSKSKSVNAFTDAHYSNETDMDINNERPELDIDTDIADKAYSTVTLQHTLHNVSDHSLDKHVDNSKVSNYLTRINAYISKGKRRLPISKTNESISSSITLSSPNGRRNSDAKLNPSCNTKGKRRLLGGLKIPSVLSSSRKV